MVVLPTPPFWFVTAMTRVTGLLSRGLDTSRKAPARSRRTAATTQPVSGRLTAMPRRRGRRRRRRPDLLVHGADGVVERRAPQRHGRLGGEAAAGRRALGAGAFLVQGAPPSCWPAARRPSARSGAASSTSAGSSAPRRAPARRRRPRGRACPRPRALAAGARHTARPASPPPPPPPRRKAHLRGDARRAASARRPAAPRRAGCRARRRRRRDPASRRSSRSRSCGTVEKRQGIAEQRVDDGDRVRQAGHVAAAPATAGGT